MEYFKYKPQLFSTLLTEHFCMLLKLRHKSQLYLTLPMDSLKYITIDDSKIHIQTYLVSRLHKSTCKFNLCELLTWFNNNNTFLKHWFYQLKYYGDISVIIALCLNLLVPLRQDFINVLTRSWHAHVGSSTRETNCNKILPSPTFVVRISTRHSLSPKSTTRKTRKENSMFGNKTYVTPPGRRKQYTPKNTSNQIKVVSEPKKLTHDGLYITFWPCLTNQTLAKCSKIFINRVDFLPPSSTTSIQ